MGKPAEAVRHLQEAVRVDPKNPEARLELGRALFDTGDVKGAIRETEALLKLDPANLDGMYNLGAIYGNLGQTDRAREYWRQAAAINPDSESGRRAKEALRQIGDTR
jgi:tetratricopeptide (TPR) repeat protein